MGSYTPARSWERSAATVAEGVLSKYPTREEAVLRACEEVRMTAEGLELDPREVMEELEGRLG